MGFCFGLCEVENSFDYGGIYLDTDVELLKSLDHLLDNKCYIGIQQAQSLCQTGLGFGAEKNSYIVEKC